MRLINSIAFAMVCAGALAGPRQEIPIRQSILPDGEVRYSIPLRIGATTVETMLDTGSTGLRVLPGTLAETDYAATAERSDYFYGSGTRLEGVVANAPLQLGAIASPVRFEAIRAVTCIEAMPHCPASRIALSDYGIGGTGFAKQGFKAIIGTRFGSADVDHPLAPLGVDRWIVDLPKPGEASPGRLILNPTAAESEGYTLFRMPDGRTSAVPACLVNLASHDKVCGRLLLDSGAPGVLVESRGPVTGLPWEKGTPAAIVVENSSGDQLAVRFTVGASRNEAIGLDPKAALPFIRISGALPYFTWSVFYDANEHTIGLKAR